MRNQGRAADRKTRRRGPDTTRIQQEAGEQYRDQHQRISWIQDDQPRQVEPDEEYPVHCCQYAEPSRDPPARRDHQSKDQQREAGYAEAQQSSRIDRIGQISRLRCYRA